MSAGAVLELQEKQSIPSAWVPPRQEYTQPIPPIQSLAPCAFEATITQKIRMGIPAENALSGLREAYVIEDRPSVTAFIWNNHLHGLLLQAVNALDQAFGEAVVRTLSLVSDEEGFQTLFCLVILPGALEDARRSLEYFDQQWWLSRCGQVAGRLNFDFELV